MARKAPRLIFHLPDDGEALRNIRRRIAELQAQAVLQYVDALPIPLSRKQKLVDDLASAAQNARSRDGSALPPDLPVVWEPPEQGDI